MKDLNSDLYIVANIVRVGKMIYADNPKKGSTQCYRRPYGVAVFKVPMQELKHEDKEVSKHDWKVRILD